MTVLSEVSSVTYAGNGTTTTFDVPFRFLAAADLAVVITDATGLSASPSFTATGAGNPSGGTLTLPAAPASSTQVYIYLDPAITQTASFVDHAKFPAKSVEDVLDKGRMIEKRTRDLVDRAMVLTDGGFSFDARGYRITDVGAPIAATDAARAGDIQAIVAARGNVPAPLSGQTGNTLVADGVGAFSWHAPTHAVWYKVEDFGTLTAINADASAAINAGLAFLATQGGGVLLLGRPVTYRVLAADIVIPEYCSLEGQGAVGGIPDGNNYGAIPYCLALGAGRTIKPLKNAGLRNLSIRTDALSRPLSFIDAYNAYRAFAGTAVTVGNLADYDNANNCSDVTLENLFIIGFDTAVSLVRADRFRVCKVVGDCTNGLAIDNIHDIARANECHFWPFLVQNSAYEFFECGILGITAAGDGSARVQTNSDHPLLVGMYVVIEGVTGTTETVGGLAINGRFKVKAVTDLRHFDLIHVDGTPTTVAGSFTGNDTDSHAVCVAYQKYGGRAFSITNSERIHIGQPFCYGYDVGVAFGVGALWTEVDQPGIDNQLYSDQFVIGLLFTDNAYRNTVISGYISSVGTSIYCNTTSPEPNMIVGGHFGSTGQFAAQILDGCLYLTSVAFKGAAPIAISTTDVSVLTNVDTDQGAIQVNPGDAFPIMIGGNVLTIPGSNVPVVNGTIDYADKGPCVFQVDTVNKRLLVNFAGVWHYVGLFDL